MLLALVAVAASLPTPLRADSEHPVRASHGMVVSVHYLSSTAGLEMLKQGGNAVDAAVATGFALAVVHPQAGNLGGGGFMMFRTADGQVHFLDFREKAPAAATEKMYLDEKGNVIEGASTIGYKAIGVPGSVAGLVYAEKHWGKLGLAAVMAPALRFARLGFPLAYSDAVDFRDSDLGKFPESRRIFQRNGNYYKAGDVFRQPELAQTLARIVRNPDGFYHGQMAKQIAAAVQSGGGLITAKDLADYEVKERAPVHGTYRGYEIVSAPPPSSGGILLIETLNVLEGYDLGRLGGNSAEAIHLTTEAFRRAYFDRAEFLGDPDFAKIPVAQLIDKKYGEGWRASIDPKHATANADLHRPSFTDLDRYAAGHSPALAAEPEHTTHFSVVDAAGNAVAVTYTLNDDFGSRVTVKGLGFLLNDEMDDFTAKPGVPNMFGLIQSPANAVGANKRPLSSMMPTMVLKDGKLVLVLGSPGGSKIPSTVTDILLDVLEYGRNIQQAVNAGRFHHQWEPDELNYEQTGFSPDTLRMLEQMGHKIHEGYESEGTHYDYWGDGECIAIDPATGERLGASDPRGNGKAMGY